MKQAKSETRPFKVSFNSDVSDSLPWSFEPLQREVIVVPGSSMLAFFRAKNNGDEPIIGVSSYNVQPSKAGAYFIKIQWYNKKIVQWNYFVFDLFLFFFVSSNSFCFEEQRLGPHEEVDMPVFFYIDPDILDDERLADVSSLTLSYTFFRSKDQILGDGIAEKKV